MSIFSSFGLKRRLSSALLSLSGIVSQIPGAEGYALIIEEVAGVIGGGGLLHAILSGRLKEFKLASLVSALAGLIALSPSIPVLAPYQPILQSLLVVLGALGYSAKK
jgi:hypothetical protein